MTTRTLTIVLCQTRESEYTLPSLQDKVLRPMASDLAFCGSTDRNELDEPMRGVSRFWWSYDEPSDWTSSLDQLHNNQGRWRSLASLGPMFLGGADLPDTRGSGAIIMYWREMLRQSISPHILEHYEWFIITRSDFLWKVPHPQVGRLDPERIYLLDGELYGGVSDRHMIFHRSLANKVLQIAAPIFREPESLLFRLRSEGQSNLNPEQYILFRLKEMGLAQRLHFLPYTGYTIRHRETATRWSQGVEKRNLDYLIKYPEEYAQARITSKFVRRDAHWTSFLGPKRDGRLRAYRSYQKTRSELLLARDRTSKWIESLRHGFATREAPE